MRVLDEHRAGVVHRLCELIVPGSGRVRAEVYIDAMLLWRRAPRGLGRGRRSTSARAWPRG